MFTFLKQGNSYLCMYIPPETQSDEPEFMYSLNDGVFGSFACKLLEESVPVPSLLKVKRFQLSHTASHLILSPIRIELVYQKKHL